MQSGFVDRKRRKETSLIIKNKHKFEDALAELRAHSSLVDQHFLMKLSDTIELKDPIFSQEISSIVIVIAVAALKTNHPDILQKEDIHGNNILRIEELADVIAQHHKEITLNLSDPTMVGWMSKVWDRLVHSSCFRNYIDIIVLYFFVGDSLLEDEKQLKRLTKLLLLSFSKIKMIYQDTLELTTSLIINFLKICDQKKYSFDLKVRLKILKILYLSKIENPNESQLAIISQSLEEFRAVDVEYFMDYLTKNQEQGSIKEQDFIWDTLFVTLLRTFHRRKQFTQIAKKLLVQMINFRIDMQTVKLVIRELEINNQKNPYEKWKNIFDLLLTTLQIYDNPKIVFSFVSSRSFMKLPLNAGRNFLLELHLKNYWKIYAEQKFLLMIQDKHRKEELWITTICEKEGSLKLILLRVGNRNILEPTQQYITCDPNKTMKILITFSASEIKLQINDNQQNSVSIQRFIEQPAFLVIGDEDETLGTSVKHVVSMSFAPNSNDNNNLICSLIDLSSRGSVSRGIKKKTIPSFYQIFKALGYMDIFLLIVSHAIKRMKTDPLIIEMIRIALKMMQKFVSAKSLSQVPLKSVEKQQRLNAILCLCWQCSHETNSALAVLQLMRVLSVRGVPNRLDQLQVLCNFVFWRQFEWQYQRLIIMKIKELFVENRGQENYLKIVHKYCIRILLETVLYYREEDAPNTKEEREQILKIHFQFITLIQEQMLDHILGQKEINLFFDFIEIVLKTISLTVSRKTYKTIDAFDLSLSVELSILLNRLGQKITRINSRERLLKMVKFIMEVCHLYDSEQYFFEDKKLSVFIGEGKFQQYEEFIIKQNLQLLAYRLLSLHPNLILDFAQSDQIGSDGIITIAWQQEFFARLEVNKNKGLPTVQYIQQIRRVYNSLPTRYMSISQLKTLLAIYLTNDQIFPKIEQEISKMFWKKLGCQETLVVLKKQLISNSKQNFELPRSSKIIKTPAKSQVLFQAKVLNLLLTEMEMLSQQGLVIMNTLKLLYPNSKNQGFDLLTHHFILKSLLQKSKRIKTSESSIELKSCVDFDSKSSEMLSFQEGQQTTNRQQYARTLEYYLSHISLKVMMELKRTSNNQEGNNHLQNCKSQLEILINYLCSHTHNNACQLKKFDAFLQTQVLPLSRYLLSTLQIPQIPEGNRVGRSPSRQRVILPMIDLQEQAKQMYFSFMDQRNLNLFKVEKTWNKIQQRNKYFWTTFLPKDTLYTLYEATGLHNQRYILKKNHKKQKLQLPRMRMSSSIVKSTSVFSEKLQFNQSESSSSMFDDAHRYKKEGSSAIGLDKKDVGLKEGRVNRFSVLLITPWKIYQGVLVVTPKKMIFAQNQAVNEELYKRIYASECEKRSEQECISENYKIEEELNSKCVAIAKRYLFHDIALQIHTNNRSYFFSFMKKDHRKACLYILEKCVQVFHRNKTQQEARRLSMIWENGQISNYQYLMKLNDIAGRSFNDLSQYYIFPWTVINFSDPINFAFFKETNNFRNLSLPIGKLSADKWKNIKGNFQRTQRDQIPQIKPFLYGSFYSNPAIVSNYLLRINPFACQHFQLQSHQFDLADRLFYSVQDSFKSVMRCSSDFKELIPQFYFFSRVSQKQKLIQFRIQAEQGYSQQCSTAHLGP